jgi:tryptophanyl-tRNA synthetase
MSTEQLPGILKLPTEEYERRKLWLNSINSLNKAEYIEIIRILKKHDEEFSENLNGIFFNVANVKQETFNSLQLFLEFTQRNRQDLGDREAYMSTLIEKSS